MSSFSSFEIARSGMYVSQRGLYVTGHNISNVNTPGYVRQQAMIADYAPRQFGQVGQIGLGADIQQTRQIRDQFLDNMFRNESQLLGHAEARKKMVEEVQTILSEPSDRGLNTVINQFFESWHELAKDPGSLTVRATVRQRGSAFADIVNHMGRQLDTLQRDLNTEIQIKINEVNHIASEIANLNSKILLNESSKDQANDFRDQRNLLLDDLAKLISVDIYERPNGMVDVSIDGMHLVGREKTETIIADHNKPNSYFLSPKWERTDRFVYLKGGTLKGLIEARGDVAGYKGSVENGSVVEKPDLADDVEEFKFDPSSNNIIPELRRGLNMLVNLMVRQVNELHRQGVGIDGSTNVDFFTKIDNTLSFEMGNIRVNEALNDDDGLNKIVAAATNQVPGDNVVAQGIVELRRERFLKAGNLNVTTDDFYNAIITWVATTGQEAGRIAENQEMLTKQIQNKKEAISGVSMDEEMTHMMRFQHAYNASARVINIVDEMINRIVNHMGIVGR